VFCPALAARRSGHKPYRLCGKNAAPPIRLMPVAPKRPLRLFYVAFNVVLSSFQGTKITPLGVSWWSLAGSNR
ncbi:hypothetical protein, partial [Sporosarcina sp. USHLN248]|uniref:hypothetical protein n=1 Tax=Sporosarcina sp. USHLN248 TaxID=3081300 RepID=UPI00301AA19F